MTPVIALAEDEAGFQAAVVELAELLGVQVHHNADSRRASRAGLPDLILIGRRVLWRELKTEKGRVRPAQRATIAALTAAGQDAGVWRPSDWGRVRVELESISPRRAA